LPLNKPIKAVVFDLDGTLVHFKINFMALRTELIEFLHSSFNFPKDLFSLSDLIMVTVEKARCCFIEKHSISKWKAYREKIEQIIKKYEWKAAKETKLVPFTLETLEILSQNDIKLGIFTLEPKDIARFILKRMEIDGYFEVISSRTDVENLKPHPEHLLFALNKLQVTAKHAAVCGDHPMDMECAARTGAFPIGIVYMHPASELIKHGARTCIKSLPDLLGFFNLKLNAY